MTGGVEGAECGGEGGLFFFFLLFSFFYIIYSLLRYKKSHGALAMAKTKPRIQNEQTKETSGTKTLQLGSVPVPGPHTGAKLNQVNQGKPFLQPADSMKNKNINLAFLRRHKVPKGNYIRRTGGDRKSSGRQARKHTREEASSRRLNEAGEGAPEGGRGPDRRLRTNVKNSLKVASPARFFG